MTLCAAADLLLCAIRQGDEVELALPGHVWVEVLRCRQPCAEPCVQLAPAALGAACMQTKTSKYRKPACSATAQEIADIIMDGYLPAAKREEREDWQPMISMDNPHFHNVSPELVDLSGQVLELPEYSPDLHQIIEHPFGSIKQDVINEIYRVGFAVLDGGMQFLRNEVVRLCQRITPEQVAGGIQGLIDCYKVVAAPRTGGVMINRTWVPGVEGGRPPKRFR